MSRNHRISRRLAVSLADRKSHASVPDIDDGLLRRREIIGVVSLGLGVAVMLCLTSYNVHQPSANWIGPVGQAIAGFFLHSFGISAYALALTLLATAVMSFKEENNRLQATQIIAYAAMIFSGAILFAVAVPQRTVWGHFPGGVVGRALGGFLVGYLSTAGTLILVVMLLAVALIASTGLPFGKAFNLLTALSLRVLRGTAKLSWFLLRRLAAESRLLAGRMSGKIKADLAARRELRQIATLQHLADIEQQMLSHERRSKPSLLAVNSVAPAAVPAPVPVIAAVGSPSHPSQPVEFADTRPEPNPVFSAHSVAPQAAAALQAAVAVEQEPGLEAPISPSLAGVGRRLSIVPPGEPAAPAMAGVPPTEGPVIIEMKTPAKRRKLKGPTPVACGSEKREDFKRPPVEMLAYHGADEAPPPDPEMLRAYAKLLEEKLLSYGVSGKVKEIRMGPVVTTFEFLPDAGIKSSKVANLANDLALQLSVSQVRIVLNIPGKGVMGIEVPNKSRAIVSFRDMVESNSFIKAKSKLTIALGKDVEGNPWVTDLRKMPHLLLAGATGTGKSVSLNVMVMSLLMNVTPEEVRLLLIDPKMVELSIYNNIPHLLLPVVIDPKKAALALLWAVEEMERRYHLLARHSVRDIEAYNKLVDKQLEDGSWRQPREKSDTGLSLAVLPDGGLEAQAAEEPRPPEKIPFIVVVIDELADLMMVAAREVETCIARLAQKARAAGIHLILATQRPSTDVLTGMIKANFPARISCKTTCGYDSKTILDANGAENLLGLGDMLVMVPGTSELVRVHGALVEEEEIKKCVDFLAAQGKPVYDENILKPRAAENEEGEEDQDYDELYDQAVQIIVETRQASISSIQRRLRIGYNRAARMVERMTADGLVGPPNGANPREVLAPGPA